MRKAGTWLGILLLVGAYAVFSLSASFSATHQTDPRIAGAVDAGTQNGQDSNSPPQTPRTFGIIDASKPDSSDVNGKLLSELGAAFPDLRNVLENPATDEDEPRYRRVLFQLLDAAKNMPGEERAAALFAADRVALQVSCSVQEKADCAELRRKLARYQISLQMDVFQDAFYYTHDLLWQIWEAYPATEWGERAFVILLDSGWDTSLNCRKGEEQFPEVIRQGESFLMRHPKSPMRGMVTFYVGEAYATWWSRSMRKHAARSQAENARAKAIADLEQAVKLVPSQAISEMAKQELAGLRAREVEDTRRFICGMFYAFPHSSK